MYVNLLSYTSGQKHLMAVIRLTAGQLSIEGKVPDAIRNEIQATLQREPGENAFLTALPSVFSGSYLRAELVKDPPTLASVLKFNPNHDAHTGEFSSGSGGSSAPTMVGITSAGSQSGAQSGARQVEQSMYAFGRQLKALPGVTNTSVVKGTGIYFGSAEPTWVVSYKGNGRAYKLLAATGQKYNQEAVLIMRPGSTDAAVELTFAKNVAHGRRDRIQAEMTKQGLAGGTWFRDTLGRSVLRMASVKDWGVDKETHLAATQALAEKLRRVGIKTTLSVKNIDTEVLAKDRYADVLKG